MAAAWTSLLSNEAITQMVGHEAFARALVAARGGHVHDVELDEQNLVVSGRVKGTYRDDYAVRVYLASSRSGTSPSRGASVRVYATMAVRSDSLSFRKLKYGMSGNSAVPSRDTPSLSARMISPSVHPPSAAGVMFFAKRTPADPIGNSGPPSPSLPGVTRAPATVGSCGE